jgi:nucleotide-binding universal stress UspA family protein
MARSTLVPLDGSDLAEPAQTWAARLAHDAGADVVRVYARPRLQVNARHPLIGRAESHEALRRAFGQLHAMSEQLLEAGLRAHIALQRGPAAEVVLEVAHRRDVDLIVMSSHGESGATRWLLGSVADAVCRQAKVPLLIVTARCDRERLSDRPLRVLGALDGSNLAEHALGVVQNWSAVVHVRPLRLRIVDKDGPARDAAEQYLADLATAMRFGPDRTTTRVEVGSASCAIARIADEEHPRW